MNDTEQFRHECESRHWLKFTGGKKRAVSELMERITKIRGKAAAEYLLAGMYAERDRQSGDGN